MNNDAIREYYLTQDNNCAETMLRVINDTYGLGLKEADFKLVSGFGGGCGCGIICGALAGAVAALGLMMVTDRAHATPNFKEACGEFSQKFAEALGSTNCAEIRPNYFAQDVRCLKTLEIAADCFEGFVKEKQLGEL